MPTAQALARLLSVELLALACCACSPEARTLGPSLPQTPPQSDRDPRIPAYQDNFYQLATGGRYFAWYGCGICHTDSSAGWMDLGDGRWRHGGGFAQVYGAIADQHGSLAYRKRIPTEVLWQLTAYVRDMPEHHAEKRRRVNLDQQAEPTGSKWSGPQ